jgi:hypothetical protein
MPGRHLTVMSEAKRPACGSREPDDATPDTLAQRPKQPPKLCAYIARLMEAA